MLSGEADLELLKDAAVEAGRLAMRFFRHDPRVWTKAGGSVVTEADVAVDRFLRERLLAARPDYGWLSEETEDDPTRRDRAAVFVVDPIDGTRDFVEGGDFWCVSLAVVEAGRPVAAALNAPARGELYWAALGGGAWLGDRRLAVSSRTGPRRGAARRAARVDEDKRHPGERRPIFRPIFPRSPTASPRWRRTGSTQPSPARGRTTGTLRHPTFWCTKRAVGSPGSTGCRRATIRPFRAMACWRRPIQGSTGAFWRRWRTPVGRWRVGEGPDLCVGPE